MSDDRVGASELALVAGDQLVRRVQSHPLSTLGGVAAAGYVLARGLPNFALRLGASVAMRAVASRVLEQVGSGPQTSPEPEPEPETHKPPSAANTDAKDVSASRTEARGDEAARAH